jgi:transposase-like protein
VKYTGENTMPVSTSTTATCPYCQNTDVRQTTNTGRIQAWSCDRCATHWAFTVQDTRAAVLLTTDLGAAARELSRLRWILRQVMMLADTAPGLTDEHLRGGANPTPAPSGWHGF